MRHSIKTIDLQTKEWFDKTYGNSYFSAQLTINFGLAGERKIYLPFQYGYGSHSEDMAFKATRKAIKKKVLKNTTMHSMWAFCDLYGIKYRYNKQEHCLKRDVTAWGVE